MKKLIFSMIVFLFLLSFFQINLLANENPNKFIFSPFPGINYPFQVDTISCGIGLFGLVIPSYDGFVFSFIFNDVKDYSEGLGIAFLFQTYKNGYSGIILSGGFNLVLKDYKGFEFGFFSNMNFGKFSGIQLGMLNFNSDDYNGLQIGFININMKQVDGFSFSLVSFNRNFNNSLIFSLFANFNFGDSSGIKLGFLNYNSKSFEGIQIGIINIASEFSGFQIGIINIAKNAEGLSLGLFNFFKNGYNRIELTFNELGFIKLNFKWGDRKFYNIVGYGMDDTQEKFQSTFGFGTNLKLFFFNFDVEFLLIGNSNINSFDQNLYFLNYNDLDFFLGGLFYLILGDTSSFSLRFNLSVPLGFVEIFAGISYHLGFKLDPETATFSWYKPSEAPSLFSDFAFFQYSWFGFSLGIQFRL